MDRSPIREDSSQPLREVDQEDVGGQEGVGDQSMDDQPPEPPMTRRGPRLHDNYSKSSSSRER